MNTSDTEAVLWSWNQMVVYSLIQNDVFIVAYMILGVIGNSIVIYLYFSKMKRKMDNRYFIPYLAILDLLASIVGSATALAYNLHPVTFTNDGICKALSFIGQWLVGSSGILLVVIAMHRYLKVCRPFGFQMTLKWKRASLVLSIIVSAASSAPTLVYYGKSPVVSGSYNVTGYKCSKQIGMHGVGLLIYTIVILVMAVSCIFSLSFFYCFIARTIYTQQKKHGKHFKLSPLANQDKFEASSTIDTDDIHEQSSAESTPKGSPRASPHVSSKYQDKNNKQPGERTHRDSSRISPQGTSKTQQNSDKQSGDNSPNMKARSSQSNSPNIPRRIQIKAEKTIGDILHKTHVRNYEINLKQIKIHLYEQKYSWMFMTITVIFILSYLPWNIITLLETIDPTFWYKLTQSQMVACLFLYRMFLLNHIANPFIYGFFDTAFRKEVKKMFACTCEITKLD